MTWIADEREKRRRDEEALLSRYGRIARIDTEIHVLLSDLSVGCDERAVPEIVNRPNGCAAFYFDFDAYEAVAQTLGTRTIRFVSDKPLRAGQSKRLVIADRVRLLPNGEVLHHLTIIRQTKWEWVLGYAFVMKSHVDDAWVAAPMERGVQTRLRNYIRMLDEQPAPVLPEEPYRPLTAEERTDELAYADVFM